MNKVNKLIITKSNQKELLIEIRKMWKGNNTKLSSCEKRKQYIKQLDNMDIKQSSLELNKTLDNKDIPIMDRINLGMMITSPNYMTLNKAAKILGGK